MEYFPEVLLICLIGGLVSIDTASGWQIMISQPVVACPVIGLIFGNVEMGIMMGVLLELPWLINIPTGGTHGSEGNLGAVVAASVGVYLLDNQVNTENIIIIASILYSLLVSRIGRHLVEFMRRENIKLLYGADRAASVADLQKITLLHLMGVVYAFILGIVLVGISFTIGILVLPALVGFIPEYFDFAFGVAKYGILGVGFGVIATLFISRETRWHLIVAFLFSLAVLLILIFRT
jgi:mannose/fructose/N-acetylgalactosamine-specific phosphotransferase system component IIC